jgi:hypothetical protein
MFQSPTECEIVANRDKSMIHFEKESDEKRNPIFRATFIWAISAAAATAVAFMTATGWLRKFARLTGVDPESGIVTSKTSLADLLRMREQLIAN